MPEFRRGRWLSLTPEPERELPRLVATLRYGRPPPPEIVIAEETRVNRLVLRRGERAWLRYLHGVVELLDANSPADPAVVSARGRAIEVLANHHNLLLGLPGRAARRTAEDRGRLNALAAKRAQNIPAKGGNR
ncbi:MAG TPA: hypothetical protein VIX82_15060 [Solirubrobacteraceae bacterium]